MPVVPDGQKLSRWRRNCILWQLWEEFGAQTVASMPAPYVQYFSKASGGVGHHTINAGYGLYRKTLVFQLARLVAKGQDDWYEYFEEWQTRINWLEWKFRPRIEEE